MSLLHRIRRRLAARPSEAGLTLVELLVASSMAIILLGGIGSMVISTMRTQPDLSEKAGNISEVRWVLERMTREIRNGVAVDSTSATTVSFRTHVRRSACGGSASLPAGSPAIVCQVTYSCSAGTCTRIEANPGVYTGTARRIYSGISNGDVFSWSPSTNPTYIEIKLRIPNPSGSGSLTVSDGVSLRNATLGL